MIDPMILTRIRRYFFTVRQVAQIIAEVPCCMEGGLEPRGWSRRPGHRRKRKARQSKARQSLQARGRHRVG